MKQKISVEIHANGEFNSAILKMVTNFNEGVLDWALTDNIISSYMKAEKYKYPNSTPDFVTTYFQDKLEISEAGKPTLTLIWKDLFELETNGEEDDLKDVDIFSQGNSQTETEILGEMEVGKAENNMHPAFSNMFENLGAMLRPEQFPDEHAEYAKEVDPRNELTDDKGNGNFEY